MTAQQQDRVRNVGERESRQVAEEAREVAWRRPSFGKQLFLGDFRLDLIYPHPRPSEAQSKRGEEFCARMREFCETSVNGTQIERDALVPDEVVKGLAAMGAFGMKIAPEYGGLGLTNLHYNRALMIAGSASPAVAAMLSAHQSIGVPQPLALFGTDEQKARYLPRCARGEISAFLLTEPDVGSDPARLSMTATPSQDGSEYVLDGVKLWTTNGVVADLLVVMARVPASDGHRGGITAFVVEASAEGVTVERRNAFMGLRGLENGVTRFHEVRVPATDRIGEEGQGLKIALTTLNTGRLSLPASCLTAAKLATKFAREWSQERVQWGRPVGEHEAVAKKVSFITATTYALEAMVELSSQLADDKQNDIRIEAALAKLYCSEMGSKIVDELVQVRGGRGYETAESLAARGERGVPAEQMLPRHADQPDLRGILGNNAAVHRARGDRRSPVGGRRPDRSTAAGSAARPRRDEGWRVLRQVAAHAGDWRRAEAGLIQRVRPASAAPAVRGACEPETGPVDVLRDGPVAGPAGAQGRLPRPDRGHRRRALRHQRHMRPGAHGPEPMAAAPSAARPLTNLPTCSAPRPGCAPRSCSVSCGTTATPPTPRAPSASSAAATPGWKTAS